MDIDVNFGNGYGYTGYNERVTDTNSLLAKLYDISDSIIFILISLAVIYIIWTTVRFIMAEDGSGRADLRMQIIWGIVGLAVILSIWGLVNILGNTFGLGSFGNEYESRRDLNSLILEQPN